MFPRCRTNNHFIFLFLFLFFGARSFSQCSVQSGPSPPNSAFNTGSNGSNGTITAGNPDLNWRVARDSITGNYQPAVVMISTPSVYYKSIWSDCAWISFSPLGEHTGDKFFFYKTNFDLPCFNPCGKSYNIDNTFCLKLDLFADNSIYEIYVNDSPQSAYLGNSIPLADYYHADGMKETGKLSVSLCKNWQAGNNSLIIKVASSATLSGMLAQASVQPLPQLSDITSVSICQGEVFHYRNKTLTQEGYYVDTLHPSSGCDSIVALHLTLRSKSFSTENQVICRGQTYSGHSSNGTYVDTFHAANGCDSVRTLNLSVLDNPKPNLAPNAEFCTGDSLILSPGVFSSYIWQDASTKDQYIVKKPGLYSVTVTNTCDSAPKWVSVSVTEKQCAILFPTAFTPNKDGKNDLFRILTNYGFQEFNLAVYNRWGQKIFEANDPGKGWDGSFQRLSQDIGTYVWICKYKKSDISTTLKGTVVLIR